EVERVLDGDGDELCHLTHELDVLSRIGYWLVATERQGSKSPARRRQGQTAEADDATLADLRHYARPPCLGGGIGDDQGLLRFDHPPGRRFFNRILMAWGEHHAGSLQHARLRHTPFGFVDYQAEKVEIDYGLQLAEQAAEELLQLATGRD